METRNVQAPMGGIMTDEVGAITGPVTVRIAIDGVVHVAYTGSDDWYTVSGGGARTRSIDAVVEHLLRDPGVDEHDNPRSTDLSDFSQVPLDDQSADPVSSFIAGLARRFKT